MINRFARPVIGVLILAVLLLTACSAGPSANAGSAFQKAPLEKGDLTAYVIANGVVHPARSAQLPWKTSGEVEQVLVTPFSTVSEGQQLATLLDSSLPTNILSARLDLLEAQRALSNLETSQTTLKQAHLALVDAKDALDKATQRHNSVVGEKRYINEAYIDGARAELMMAETEVDKAQNDYDHMSGRGDDDPEKAIALKMLSQAKQARDRSLGNLNYVTGSPSAKEVDRATVELSLAEAQLADAQHEFDRLKDGVPAEDLLSAQTRVQIAQATLDLALVTAPFSGTVTNVTSLAGDLVQPGDLLLALEDQSHMYIDSQVSEIDINRLFVDQYVEVSLDAVWGQTFSGKVVEIGSTGSNTQGVVNFPVRVELIDRDPSVKSGMTAALRILVEQLSDVLLVPNQAVRVQDGQRIVYVDQGGPIPVAVPLTLGVSSETTSQVLAGEVKEGEMIILNPDLLLNPAGSMVGQ